MFPMFLSKWLSKWSGQCPFPPCPFSACHFHWIAHPIKLFAICTNLQHPLLKHVSFAWCKPWRKIQSMGMMRKFWSAQKQVCYPKSFNLFFIYCSFFSCLFHVCSLLHMTKQSKQMQCHHMQFLNPSLSYT